jgi:hypothetical protein
MQTILQKADEAARYETLYNLLVMMKEADEKDIE